MKKFPFLILALFCLSNPTLAQNMEDYAIQSGTGFFVNRHYVITNAHVVEGCKEAIIKGGVPEQRTKVRILDKQHDLAILETDKPPPQFAPLRYNIDDLKTGDKVMVIGYPGEAGARGEYTVAEARIEDIKINDADNTRWLYITDVVTHGNSGGPVFDTSGNVIGVVVAKAVITTYNPETQETLKEQKLGVVISLKTLRQFLFDHGVFSEFSGSGVVFADSYIEEHAKDYIVNVQCRIKVKENEQASRR